jgi:hypothetical protein
MSTSTSTPTPTPKSIFCTHKNICDNPKNEVIVPYEEIRFHDSNDV